MQRRNKKRNVVCKEENIDKHQYSRRFVSGCEHALRKTQWQIYQARSQGKIAHLHALQERLCESFCARFLATEYAIVSLQLNRVQIPPLISLITCEPWEGVKSSTHPMLARSTILKDTPRERKGSRKRGGYKQDHKETEKRRQIPEDWKILIAQSFWHVHKSKSERKGLLFSGRLRKGRTSNHLSGLEQSFREKIQEQAKQIHALFALEPEWQAIFSGSQGQAWQALSLASYQQISTLQRTGLRDIKINKSAQKPSFLLESDIFLRKTNIPSQVAQPGKIIKRVKSYVKSPFSQFVFTASIRDDCLGTINQELLIKTVQTFSAMEKQIQIWVKDSVHSERSAFHKTGFCKSQPKLDLVKEKDVRARVLHNSVVQTERSSAPFPAMLKGEHLARQHGNFWCLSINTQPSCKKDSLLDPSLQKKRNLSWLFTKYSLYSSFPQLLWKQEPIVYNATQIEDHVDNRNHVINSFLLRVMLYDLVKRMQRFSQNSLKSSSCIAEQNTDKYTNHSSKSGFFPKHSHLCSKQESKSTVVEIENKESVNTLAKLKSFSTAEKEQLFCAGYGDHFVLIHPNQRFLKGCVLQAQHYCPGISAFTQVLTRSAELGSALRVQRTYANACAKGYAPALEKNNRQEDLSFNGISVKDDKKRLDFQNSLCLGIKDCRQGFTLLGFQIIQVASKESYVCKVTPSKESVRALALLLQNRIKQSKNASTCVWVARLNLLICRWVEYYKSCEYKPRFQKISYLLWEKARSWLSRRDFRRSRQGINK